MECPHCKHKTDDTALLQCSQCGEAFERGLLEEVQHLAYLRKWLEERTSLDRLTRERLIALADAQRNVVLEQMLPKMPPVAEAPTAPQSLEQHPIPLEVKPQPPLEVGTLTPAAALPAPEVVPIQPKPAPVAVPKPPPPPRPVAPPKPTAPPIDWKKVQQQLADFVTSGALLRALLYLGAFMIVISATVLVIRFWNNFHPALQILFIAAVPAGFYAGGWLLRTRLKIVQAGTVLTGIGAILVAVDFAAVYQFTGLAGHVNGPAYWLVAAFVCTALYTFTAWRLPGEFFDYITLISGASILFVLTRLFNTPLEWSVASITLAGAGMALLAARFKNLGGLAGDLAKAARYLAQIVIPASVVFVMFSRAALPVGPLAGFVFALFGYVFLAWQFPSLVFAYSALGASLGAVFFALRVAQLDWTWYATVAGVCALMYILVGAFLKRAQAASVMQRHYRQALNGTGFVLIVLAVFGGFVTFIPDYWRGVIALTVASFTLAVSAFIFRHPGLTFITAGLFILPFSFGAGKLLSDALVPQAAVWFTVAWSGLALVYILLAALLRKAEYHALWLYFWAHGLMPLGLVVLLIAYRLGDSNMPALVALGGACVNYLLTFILQDSHKHRAFAPLEKWIPLGRSFFLWPLGFIAPILGAVAWRGSVLQWSWFGAALAGGAIVYIAVGQGLARRLKEYRLPFHTYAYFLCLVGLLNARSEQLPLLGASALVVIALAALAYVYNRVFETALAAMLFILPFTLTLRQLNIVLYAHNLGYVVLAALVYIPLAVYLNKFEKSRMAWQPLPLFGVGYLLMAYAVIAAVIGRAWDTYLPWVGALVPLVATALLVYSTAYFKASELGVLAAWSAALTFALAFGQALTFFAVPAVYQALSWAGGALAYMLLERSIQPLAREQRAWLELFRRPLIAATLIIAALALVLSAPESFNALGGVDASNALPAMLAQFMIVLLAILAARLYQQAWPLIFEPLIVFVPVTLFFIVYGERLFRQALTTPQFAWVWTGLGLIHLVPALLFDRAKTRYSHGLYLGGYAIASWALLWSWLDRSVLVWSLGLWIAAALASALLVHFHRHHTWDDLIRPFFGDKVHLASIFTRNLFQWLAAWTFPIWGVIFLRTLNVLDSYAWLGLVVPALGYLALTLWFERIDHAYTYPLHSAAQCYVVAGLLITAPQMVGYAFSSTPRSDELPAFVLLHGVAVVFYIFSAWNFKARFFAHLAAWLSILPFTVAWKLSGIAFTSIMMVIPWLLWALILLAVGFALDKNKVRYSQAPYLAGYALTLYALLWSVSDRVTNILALAITILLALISYVIFHFGRHHAFEDFISFFWRTADTVPQQAAATSFLFFAAYALPVLLTQTLAYYELSLAWRGVALALAAPIYIAFGLALRRVKPRTALIPVPTWAVYSAGYALTAIGAMVAFADERLATYVLALDALVYLVSAYIFQQTFWLYLATVLAPVVALLILHQTDHLNPTWSAWTLSAFAFAYLGLGQLFDRIKKFTLTHIHPVAMPFYAPGFVMSAVALALGSDNRDLALPIYSVGVVFYALAGVLFRETLFIYPAAWLAAIPYYLVVTMLKIEVQWYGLAWLPLIVIYLALGRFVFHKRSLAPLGQGVLVQWLLHPAVPFYVLVYALSLSMIILSAVTPLTLTLSFAASAVLYLGSALLFRKPGWLYAGLFVVHMTLLTYFTINPSGGKAYYLAIPFTALAWIMSLVGAVVKRVAPQEKSYRWSLLDHLLGHSWARPFFIFAFADILIWQAIALYGYDTTIIVALSHMALLALFSLLWMSGALVYGVVGFGLLALGAALKQAGVPFAFGVAAFGGVGFSLYLLARILEALSARIRSFGVWPRPLTNLSIGLTALTGVVNLFFIVGEPTATAAALAFAGALYVAIAYRGRQYALGYFGMALLEVAWIVVLYMREISQPQFYAIPGGLYFLGVAFLEARRERRRYALAVELLGLGVLLLPSFIQSLNREEGLPYFILFLAEGFIVLAWGVFQRRKSPFFTGIGAVALNIVAQLILLMQISNITRWIVALGAGLLIMVLAIFVERRRELVRARLAEFGETLEKWD